MQTETVVFCLFVANASALERPCNYQSYLCISFAVFVVVANTSAHDGPHKDSLSTRHGTKHKKQRRKDKGYLVSNVIEADSLAAKFGYLSIPSKFKSKGLSGNRSTENILRDTEAEMADAPPVDASSESVEVSFEIRKKYDKQELNYFCVENEKRSIRRAKSNDSLLMQHRIVIRQPNRAAVIAQIHDKAQTLPTGLSKSRETLESSGDTTTSEDGRTESCSSSVLESEL